MSSRIFFLLGICLFGYLFGAQAQIITTIAGNGVPGFGGDGTPATTAQLHNPSNLTLDRYGNMYISDNTNERIRKVAVTGIITTYAGTGIGGYNGDSIPATDAELFDPAGLAIDSIGNLYIADQENSRIRKTDTAGIITTIAGNGTGGYSGDGIAATTAELYNAEDVAVDVYGKIYISDLLNNRIRKITTGIISTIAGTGIGGSIGDGLPATSAQINRPGGITFDRAGNFYLADVSNNKIRKIDLSGIITTYAGTGVAGYSGDGGPATAAQLRPTYIAADGCGNLYISEHSNERVRKINPAGIITTIAGTGTIGYSGDGLPATGAELNNPYGIAVDAFMNIYIADAGNSRVRMISTANHPPAFTGGHSQSFAVCMNATLVSIDSLLTITDFDTLQTETWNLVTDPMHGTVMATYSNISTGSNITPIGLSYTPTTGYAGDDTFKIAVTDCGYAADTTTIYVGIDTSIPNVGVISGSDSVCIGVATVALTDTVSGGMWGKSNLYAGITGGVVSGVTMGVDTLFYIVSNACGSDTATHAVMVVDCTAGVASPRPSPQVEREVSVWPNPNGGEFMVSVLSAAADEEAQIVVSNVVGERVKEITAITNTPVHVTLSQPAGVYFISVTTASGNWSGKVVVGR